MFLPVGVDRLDLSDIKQTAMAHLDRKYRAQLSLKHIVNGYRRLDPTRGMEYILDLLLMDRSDHNKEIVKRVHLVKPLGRVELVPMPYVTETMMVNIILPLNVNDVGLFDEFMATYARACLQNPEDVRLIVALLYPSLNKGETRPNDPFAKAKSVLNNYNKKYDTKGKLAWKALENIVSDIEIVDALLGEFQTEVLILMTSVNMEIAVDSIGVYFNRVRMNTIKSKQVFFPMAFWQYRPDLIYSKKPYPTSVEVGQKLGLFSTKSTDHASFYISDYKAARQTITQNVVRTTDIFSMFVSYKNFHIFQAVEPNLKLRWMNMTCDPRVSTEKYQQCVTQNTDGLASQHHLALLVYKQRGEVISQSEATKSRHQAEGVRSQGQGIPVMPQEGEEGPQGSQISDLRVHAANLGQPEEPNPQAEGMLLVPQKKKK